VPRLVGAVLVAILAVLTVLTYGLRIEAAPLPIPLFPVLTIVFITSGSIIVSYVSTRAYLKEGLPTMLFLGSATLTFGVAALVAALMSGTAGSNSSTTLFILAALVSAFLHLSCGISRFAQTREHPGSRAVALSVIALSLAFVAAIALLANQADLPTLLNPGYGTTIIAKTLLGIAIATYLGASLLIGVSSTSPILYWYSWALAALATGLFGLYLSDWVFMSVVFWTGRIAICVGGVFMVLSVLSAEGGKGGSPETMQS